MLYDWKFISRKELYNKGFISIFEDRYSKGPGKEGSSFYILDLPNWVNIVAVTKTNKIILIKQYRFGSRDYQIEIPGGAVDSSDRDILTSAKRELLEETGYAGNDWTKVGAVAPNPAIQSNYCFTYLAMGVEYTMSPSFDENEDIETILADISDVYEMVHKGQITHSLVICALMYAERFIRNTL